MSQTRATPGRLPEPFTIEGSVACRTWDDFLVVAAQRWKALRQELMSGRLDEYLRRIGRADLLSRTTGYASADEQLDRWLGRLPVSRSSVPELDVHPDRLEVRDRGGTTRHVVRISNVGFRLLRGTVRIEPPGTGWLRIDPTFRGPAFTTVEETELPIEVEIPDGPGSGLAGAIVIATNGGTRRVEVAIVPAEKPMAMPVAPKAPVLPRFGWLAGIRGPTRIAAGVAAALAVRLLVLASGLLPIGAGGATIAEPRLPALAVSCAAVAAVAGLRKGGPVAAVAAGLLGVMAAALLHALVRTVEAPLGTWSSSLWAIGLVWAALGAAVATGSCLVVPVREPSGEASP